MRLPVKPVLPLAALLLASAGPHAAEARQRAPEALDASGPAADYPITIGDPFTVDGTTWTPADELNYDAVGYAAIDEGAPAGISAAHKTLPLPCYVEVTDLDTGKTILVRLTQRGPMRNDTLVALSPGAAAQLGLAPGSRAAVRVRRVNPPEPERAALRSGGAAAARMETPEALLKVLRRKLADNASLMPPKAGIPSKPPVIDGPVATSLPKPAAADPARPVPPPRTAPPHTAPAATRPPAAAPAPRTAAPRGTTVVQVAAFSTQERAARVAAQLKGRVVPAGRVWRVRLGPFDGSGEAGRALEKARAAGYRDARIQRAD